MSCLLTTEQAARRLSISRARLYELLMSGQIESVKIGASRRVPDEAVDDYIGKLRAGHAGTVGGGHNAA
jgi:excisionase family DNA binding protein